MDNTTMDVRLEHWTQLVQDCVNSGLTKKEWCEKNQIQPKTFYYWQRRVRQNALAVRPVPTDSTAITEIEIPSDSGETRIRFQDHPFFQPDIVIRDRTLTIEISNTASKQLLSNIGQVIRYVG